MAGIKRKVFYDENSRVFLTGLKYTVLPFAAVAAYLNLLTDNLLLAFGTSVAILTLGVIGV